MFVRKITQNTIIALSVLGTSEAHINSPNPNKNENSKGLIGHVQKSLTQPSTEITRTNPQLKPLIESNYKNFIRFESDKETSLQGKICRAYIPPSPKGKPLYVLILGHAEELDISTKYSGIMYFYQKLIEEEKGIALLFKTGLAQDEFIDMISSKNPSKNTPQTVFENTKNIIQALIKEHNPKELRFVGYSWGGGTIDKLTTSDEWRQGTSVKTTVMIDPIILGGKYLGIALRKRPEFKDSPEHKHMHIYQHNPNLKLSEWFTTLQGNYPIKKVKDEKENIKFIKDERPGDIIWHIPNTAHLDIDDVDEVRQRAYLFLTSETKEKEPK